jgi:recombination protein RecT
MNTTQQQSRQLTPAQEINRTLNIMAPEFQKALNGDHKRTEKFVRVAATAINGNANLLKADRTSLYAACNKAAADGLLPDGREAAFVMFGNQAQYMPMMAGILKKLRNSGELSSITALIVHRNDNFKYWVDSDGEHLNFEPNMFAERGEVIGVFAMAKLHDGALYVEVLTKAQVEQVRKVSKAANNGPWVTWWDEMARKTAMRRLSKRLPMSTDMDGLFGHDDDEHVVAADTAPAPRTAPEMRDVTPEPEPEQPKRQSRAQAAVAAKKTPPPPAEEPPLYDGPGNGEIIDGETGEVYGGDGSDGGPVADDEIPI